MAPTRQQLDDDASYRRLKATIDSSYPKGQFVALHDGRVIADGATLDELDARIGAAGGSPRDVLAAQAGVDYPAYVHLPSPITRL